MTAVTFKDRPAQTCEQVSEAVTRTSLRAEPGEKRVLIKIEAGRTYSHYSHTTPMRYLW